MRALSRKPRDVHGRCRVRTAVGRKRQTRCSTALRASPSPGASGEVGEQRSLALGELDVRAVGRSAPRACSKVRDAAREAASFSSSAARSERRTRLGPARRALYAERLYDVVVGAELAAVERRVLTWPAARWD